MSLGPETWRVLSIMPRRNTDGGDSRVRTLHFENIVSYTVDICGPGLDKAVWQSLHIPNLVPFGVSVFLVVVTKHRGPWNLPLGYDLRKLGQDGFRVP